MVGSGGEVGGWLRVLGRRHHERCLRRHEMTTPLAEPNGWQFFAPATINPLAYGDYASAVFANGRFYLVPLSSGAAVRFDPEKPFQGNATWEFAATPRANATQFGWGEFDGQFVYFVPASLDDGGPSGEMVRYDTSRAFDEEAAWSRYNVLDADGGPVPLTGAAFDGHDLYFGPKWSVGHTAVRFRAIANDAVVRPPGAHAP